MGGRGLSARIAEVPRSLTAAHTSASLFSLLDAQPAAGRLLTAQDEQPEAAAAAVLSYESWQRALPAAQCGGGAATYVARTSVPPGPVMRTLQSALETGAGVEVRDLRTLDEHVLRSIHVPRFRACLFGLMGLLVTLLTAVGVFSVTAHGVVQRRREIGIRLALGASGPLIVSLVTGQAAWPVLVGLAIGLVAAYNTNHLVAHFLYRTTLTDPIAMAAVSVGVLALALLAAYVPARRTLGINPVEVLRLE